MADVHLLQSRLPLAQSRKRLLLLVPQQPDELVLVAAAQSLVQLQPVQQLTVLIAKLPPAAFSHTTNNSSPERASQVNWNDVVIFPPTGYGRDDSSMA